ncbi:MAG: TRAP transporter substrate-binding protein [Spirochaetia bacterium]|jgi:tripartite ATP-independent transporter DctP family solute receptor|uniref:Solute-binding protein n=1 Tax=bioreactor metagenome TaxID=1076179 RepID=A0A644TV66_9ZZZZ|nr:TRAP transporter substrate-binding protein [Spirochaetia bacterium]NLX44482.1 TRAP transporter substrate-binding protein [Treponema sp.]VBB40205.1 TRAP dicarboxylate transporter, DctP subunit [uncultured Spirochaetota bacterium]HAP55924.1 C4-dicarboxylate ABC transporter [Spirochaetaceae bacterium]HOI22254.1 TRAP transporter substrate-binding protein [Spirochaetales bacterium]
MKKARILIAVLLVIAALMPAQLFAQAKPIVLRLAETHPQDYPTTKGDYEFARLVKERSGGRIQIEVYYGSQLGQEKAVIEQVQFGAIDMTRVSISPVASFVPKLNAFQMPYLYRDEAHMWKVLKGDIGKGLLASLEPFGFIGLGWFEAGSRNFYNSKRPITKPEELKGLKIRVQESELMMGLVSAFGAVPTPMAYGEVYSALQTGVVDGAENNWPSYFSTSHYEVAKYFCLDEHTRVPEIIIGSKISLGRLSKADQDLIKQAALDAIDYQRAEWAKYEQISIDKVKAGGAQISYIGDKTEWQKLMDPLYKKQSKEIQDFVKQIQAVK